MRTTLVIQQGFRTPTEPSFGNSYIHGIRGLAFASAFTSRSTGRKASLFTNGSDADRWLEVPAWMFDRSACAKVRVSNDAHVDLAAIVTLTALATSPAASSRAIARLGAW